MQGLKGLFSTLSKVYKQFVHIARVFGVEYSLLPTRQLRYADFESERGTQ